MSTLFASVINMAAQTEDQTKETSTAKRIIPAGKAMARFVEYVELGPQHQTFNGKPKPDCEEVRIAFELLHPDGRYTYEVGGETFNDLLTWKGPKKLNAKGQFFKLMKKMAYGRAGITHMAQMLGEAFIVEVKHNESEKDGKKSVYAGLFSDSECNIMAPVQEDVITGETKRIPVPEATRPMRCFIWKCPTKECWDSIFIDGTRTVKDANGHDVEKSNNWMQETLLTSPAFSGSALEVMLAQEAGELPKLDDSALMPTPSENMDDVPF